MKSFTNQAEVINYKVFVRDFYWQKVLQFSNKIVYIAFQKMSLTYNTSKMLQVL